jgi:hypothetical protein
MKLIDADELKTEINKIIDEEIEIDEKWSNGLKYSFKIIDNTPTVPLSDFKEGYKQAIIDGKTNFSRPHGKWIYECLDYSKCSNCNYANHYGDLPFCPNCGASMEEAEND